MISTMLLNLRFDATRHTLHADAAWFSGDRFRYEFTSGGIWAHDFQPQSGAAPEHMRSWQLRQRDMRFLLAIRHATGALTLVKQQRGWTRLRELKAIARYLRPRPTRPLDDPVLGIVFDASQAEYLLDALRRLGYDVRSMNWQDVIDRKLLPFH